MAEVHGYKIRPSERCSDALTYTCRMCDFKVSVRANYYAGKYYWRVTKLSHHRCPGDESRTNYSAAQLASALMRSNEFDDISTTAAESFLKHFVRAALQPSFVHAVLAKSRKLHLISATSKSFLQDYASIINKSTCGTLTLHMEDSRSYGFTFARAR